MAIKRPLITPVGAGTRYLNMALVAESGFGKTVMLGTAGPKMLILSLDPEGTDSAFFQGSKAQHVVIRQFEELEEVVVWLREEGHREFDFVAVDSAPEAQKIMQMDWLIRNREKAKGRHPDVLGMDGYQITQNQFIKFVKQMNDLAMHTIYTAKPLEMYDAEGEVYYLPNIHGQKGDMARDFQGYMKVQGFGTYHTKKVRKADKSIEEKQVRRWYFSPETAYKGKDRTDSLGPYLDDPTIPSILKLIEDKAAASGAAAPKKTRTTTRRRQSA